MITINNLSYSYGKHGQPVLSSISIEFARSTVSVVVGPSGCGKTTLLNLLGGILDSPPGTISSHNTDTGYVFQAPSLVPWRTVWANALLGAEIRRVADGRAQARTRDLVQSYGLRGCESHFPSALSGGMQQRVAMIRAIVAGATVLLLDEPFSDSDFQMRRALQQDLSRAVDEEHLTAILVTHDLEEAVQIGDRIIVLTPRPAQVAADIVIPIPRPRRFQHKWSLDPELLPYLQQVWAALDSSGRDRQEVLGSNASI